MSKLISLVVVSHVQHYQWNGNLWAFGPYTREIDIWADLFPVVNIVSPCIKALPPGDCLPFSRTNINISPTPFIINNKGFISKLLFVFSLPIIIWYLDRAMRKAWAIHVRIPGNLGAIGSVMAPLYSKRIIAKYAGTWPDFDGEPFSYRLQKKILRSRWFSGPVTVYGDWPSKSAHIIPFFTSILTSDQIDIAHKAAQTRFLHSPARLLFVGRMDKGKNAHVLLDTLYELKQRNFFLKARIIGDGNEMEHLVNQTKELQLEEDVTFLGAIPFSEVLENYLWGDILVLTSENSEGWPKAIAEGMAFGLVCFGSQRGLIPQMLADGRGIVIWPVTSENLAKGLEDLLSSPQRYLGISRLAAGWSQRYSLDGLREAIRDLLIESWNLSPDLMKPIEFFRIEK